MTNRERLDKAAKDVHTIAAELNRVADEISDPKIVYSSDVDYAYARLYHLRHDLGKIVSSLGYGLPRKDKEARGIQ